MGARRNIWVYANHKGGVGKSTTLRLTAAVLAARGKRVLVVDMDPNANVSHTLLPADIALAGDYLTTSDLLYAVMEQPETAEGVARSDFAIPSSWKNVDVIPSKLSLIDRTTGNVPGLHTALAVGLHGIENDYDMVLIDTPPYLGPLAYNAFTAADWALLITLPEFDSVNGLQELMNAVVRTQKLLGNPGLQLAGTIVNMQDTRRRTHSLRLEEIQEGLAGTDAAVWAPVIPRRAVIGDSVETATPITEMGGGEAVQRIVAAVGEHVDRMLALTETGTHSRVVA